MDTLKTIGVALVTALVVVLGFGAVGEDLAGVPGVNLIPTQGLENSIEWAKTSSTSTYTLSHAESGSVLYASASGTTITLPAVRDELVYRFVVAGAIDTDNLVIASAEGDNIEGSLIVAGAVVDCAAEDFVNFIADGENLGDFLELRSNGTSWFITASNALTTAKLTCTDPS